MEPHFCVYVSVCVCARVCVFQHLKLQTSLTEYPRTVEFYLLDPSRATGSCECEKLVMFPPPVRCLDTQQFSNMPAPTFSSVINIHPSLYSKGFAGFLAQRRDTKSNMGTAHSPTQLHTQSLKTKPKWLEFPHS